jgi:DnaK suppressor protein
MSQIALLPSDDQAPGFRPAWRSFLEARWQQRLSTLTELSLAYHDAAERPGDGGGPAARTGDPGEDPRVRQLLRKATAARRALRDTEEALARLSDGSYGWCEQCAAPIAACELLAEPETRYCAACATPLPRPRIGAHYDGEGPVRTPRPA